MKSVAFPNLAAHRRARPAAATTAAAPARGWVALGALPSISVFSSLGLLLVALADGRAREQQVYAPHLFWLGLIVVFVPSAVRLVSATPQRAERLGLVVLVGVLLYLVKVCYSPTYFNFPDELQHWRSINDILRSDRLFRENPILPVSPYFPGLELITHALVSLSGLDIFLAGLIVVGVARILFVVALFLFFESIGGSHRVAGIAVMVYMTNPSFVFVDGQFGYESVALPIAMLVLFTLTAKNNSRELRLGLSVAALLLVATVVVTHHISSYALVAFLALWTLSSSIVERGQIRRSTEGIALIVGVVSLAWIVYAATLTVNYLAPTVTASFEELARLISGESQSRQLFRSHSGQSQPLWQRVTGLASTVATVVALAPGIWLVWRHGRQNGLMVALGLAALAYPATLAMRLTPFGVRVGGRAPEFLFLGVGFVIALGLAHQWPVRARRGWNPLVYGLVGGAAGLLVVGGVIVGYGPPERIPGPYLVGADQRSIERQGLATTSLFLDVFGPDHRVGADRTNAYLMASYGEQQILTNVHDEVPIAELFFSPNFAARERAIIADGAVDYLVVDARLAGDVPYGGVYFEAFEPGAQGAAGHAAPIASSALAKFDGQPNVNRVLDSGDIVVYDVRAAGHDA